MRAPDSLIALDLSATPTVTAYDQRSGERFPLPCVYRRGVFAVVEFGGGFAIMHVPTGGPLCDKDGYVVPLRNADVAINAVRALTPWSEVGADLTLADDVSIPQEAFDAVNAVVLRDTGSER